MTRARRGVLVGVCAALAACAAAACGGGAPASGGPAEAARVGDAVLRADALDGLVAARVAAGADSAEARRAAVEAWVRRALLVQDARARGLDTTAAVRAALAEAEADVLAQAALDALLADAAPTDAEIAAAHAEGGLGLVRDEPQVRVRLVRAAPERADGVREGLARLAARPDAEAVAPAALRELSADPAGAASLAQTLVPESALGDVDAALARAVAGMRPGPGVAVVPSSDTPDAAVFVVQLVERVPAGAVPPLAAVRAEIAARLAERARTTAEARAVDRLRAEAVARGQLSVR